MTGTKIIIPKSAFFAPGAAVKGWTNRWTKTGLSGPFFYNFFYKIIRKSLDFADIRCILIVDKGTSNKQKEETAMKRTQSNLRQFGDFFDYAQEQERLGTTLKDTEYTLKTEDEDGCVYWENPAGDLMIAAVPHYDGHDFTPVKVTRINTFTILRSFDFVLDFVWSPMLSDERNWMRYEKAVYEFIQLVRSI